MPDTRGTKAFPDAGVRILNVESGSIAERLGLRPGDILLSLNTHPVGDVIDYWFHGASRRLKVEWCSQPDGARNAKVVSKAHHERLGIELEPFEIKRCSNYCVFCFVHQLPPGLRRELYLKDEDFRLSFLYGNYITGTNLTEQDIRRIGKQKLSPLYFSVHATDQEIREQLLAKRGIPPIMPLLKRLAGMGIAIHTQVVLCPGINDGEVLDQTVSDLAALYPRVESIAVVPVGLTEHRSRLPRLEAVTPDYARRFLDTMVALQRKTRKRIGYPVVFPSDEFFLIAQLDPPSYSDYPEIPQIENGVGMFSRFHGKFSELCASFPKRVAPPRRIGAITTFMGARVIRRLIEEMNLRIEGLEVDFLTTSNSLFGRDITVTGLLPGADFQRVMQENPGYDRFLVPANSLRPWDNRFLDNMTLEELRASTKAEIAAGGSTAASFVAAALEPLILPA